MARYTIDGQILTDLGDVVRGAKFEITPKEVRSAYSAESGYNGETYDVSVELIPTQYTKLKITILAVEWIEIDKNPESMMTRPSINFTASPGAAWYWTDELPWSHTCDKHSGGYIRMRVSNGAANVTYMIEPCDENGELIKCTYTPEEIVDEIRALPLVPNTALELTGSFSDRFRDDFWNWFIENNGHLITTNKISNLSSAFYNSQKLKSIPFNLNIASNCSNLSDCFYRCYQLTEAPKIVGQLSSSVVSSYSGPNFSSVFQECSRIRELPDDYFTSLAPHEVWTSIMGSTYGDRDSIFYGCNSLRKVPDISKLVNYRTSSSSNLYCNTFRDCYCLDEVTNLPLNARLTGNGFSASSNLFSNTFEKCSRLKNMTFEMNPENGNPLPAYWNKQTITLSNVGWHSISSTAVITDYNSGITKDKQVTDDASYQALKNDPDWWTTDMAYSRYNRASAVATINSLPDTSERGGSNTITFKGAAGSKTDGGAISDLTEAQIAVAAAKGWTVSIV